MSEGRLQSNLFHSSALNSGQPGFRTKTVKWSPKPATQWGTGACEVEVKCQIEQGKEVSDVGLCSSSKLLHGSSGRACSSKQCCAATLRQRCSECQTLYCALEYDTSNSQPGPGAVIFAVGASRDFCVVVAEEELRLLLVVPCSAHSGGR